jgi:hypothetical protein
MLRVNLRKRVRFAPVVYVAAEAATHNAAKIAERVRGSAMGASAVLVHDSFPQRSVLHRPLLSRLRSFARLD